MLVQHGTDYESVRHEGMETDGRIAAFFADTTFEVRSFDNEQRFDLAGLKGRTW